MPVTDTPYPKLRFRADTQPGEALYELVLLPDDEWQQRIEDLVLPEDILRPLLRFCLFLLHYRREARLNRLMMLTGPPGTGKSDAVRGIASTIMRSLSLTGNALNIRVSALYNEELGRSAKQVDKLLDDVRLSAKKCPTFLILDDAEALFLDRKHMMAAKELGDVLRVSTTLLAGLDNFKFQPNVIMFATLNIQGAIDEALLSRASHILSFALPTHAARLAILGKLLTGTPGEQVLADLAEATEGWSGRDLTKIPLKAFLFGTAGTPDEMTPDDYLRAVGALSKNSAVDDMLHETAKEDICTSSSLNRFLADSLPRSHKWMRP